jgi:short-subunit dehydrogenase
MKDQWILITGASSGIGEGFARAYARRGYPLILVARRMERLEKLRKELGDAVEVVAWAADLMEEGAAARLAARAEAEGRAIYGLVNNAGLGFQKDLADLSEDEVGKMLRVNIVALTELCHRFLPGLLSRGKGFVLNIASTAAFQPVPHFSIYAASKTYVVSLSEALHEEAKPKGVLVSCLCPGPVDTEFQQVAGMDPRFFVNSQSVEEVVREGVALVQRRGAMGWSSLLQRLSSLFSDIAPRGLRRKVAGRVIQWNDERAKKYRK